MTPSTYTKCLTFVDTQSVNLLIVIMNMCDWAQRTISVSTFIQKHLKPVYLTNTNNTFEDFLYFKFQRCSLCYYCCSSTKNLSLEVSLKKIVAYALDERKTVCIN